MILTDRDRRLLKDIALSHVLSRDQILNLSYFGSVSRANRRLRSLCESGLLRQLTVPLEQQRLYVAGAKAVMVVGERIGILIENRSSTPRFLQHALMTTDVRIALLNGGGEGWRYEQQVRDSYFWAGRTREFRPDGLVTSSFCVQFVEVDLGHVSRPKFARKVREYASYVASGRFLAVYGEKDKSLLVVTTGSLRRAHLSNVASGADIIPHRFMTYDELGIACRGGWS